MKKAISTKSVYARFFEVICSNCFFLFIYFFFINLPFLIYTCDTGNWSDDFAYMNLLPLKAQVKPIWAFMFESVGGEAAGGHFAPFYFVLNYLLTLVSFNPYIIHFEIFIIHLLTAVVAFFIVLKLTEDKLLAFISSSLFTSNYYLSFKALTWNCFHSHMTNTFTGLVSVLALIMFTQTKRKRYLICMVIFILFSILNLESGFIFVPVLIILISHFYRKKILSLQEIIIISSLIFFVSLVYPVGAYLSSGQLNPLGHRFSRVKSVQTTLYNTADLMINSSGLGIYYDKWVVDKIKSIPELKEVLIDLIRNNNLDALNHLQGQNILTLIFSVGVMLAISVFMLLFFSNLKGIMRVWGVMYATLAVLFIAIFYRIDIVNGIGFFSAVIVGHYVLTMLRSSVKKQLLSGVLVAGLIAGAYLWTIADKFEGCYRRSFFGINKIAVKGPYDIYHEMNKQIGHFSKHGLILFTHDYSMYHRESGYRRIGDMLGLGDFIFYNAAFYAKDFLSTDLKDSFRNKTLIEFFELLMKNSNYVRIIVHSKQEAIDYLRVNNIDLNLVDVIYLSKDYEVEKLGIN